MTREEFEQAIRDKEVHPVTRSRATALLRRHFRGDPANVLCADAWDIRMCRHSGPATWAAWARVFIDAGQRPEWVDHLLAEPKYAVAFRARLDERGVK